MSQYSNVVAILLAAGVGSRIESSIPKQYIKIDNITSLAHNILLLEKNNMISAIQVVINQNHIDLYEQEILNLPLQATKLLPVVVGGNTRQESSRIGLQAIENINPKYVIIHDAARPFCDDVLIQNLIEELQYYKVVIPACNIYDTVKRTDDQIVIETLKRDNIYLAQTPQAFHYHTLIEAHNRYQTISCTDDAEMCEKMGIKVKIVDSFKSNFKITDNYDLKIAQMLMHNQYEFRVGMGFDVHKFDDNPNLGTVIYLGGIEIPHDRAIIAHSDGDVVLHALCDALLGSIGAGDIGIHFPSTDNKWKGVRSTKFVDYVLKMLVTKNVTVINVDITIIGEVPKIAPYSFKMQDQLSKILSIATNRINIKATTTEKMGFIGRKEGIAAQVVASIRM
ncbi:MAG: 2-C-methyl-D-erythritol 4-phosphate cytidylyltransferase [Rickettsiales endosymbiont of Dermacentor nuttalli]